MEYAGQYTVTARAHTRPYAKLCTLNEEITRLYPGAHITIREADTMTGCDSILNLMFSQIGTRLGTEIEVVVRGEYDYRTLEGIADRVGAVFAQKDVLAEQTGMMLGIRRK
jgi:phosphotransferase system HPr-like phosphotransfer protein